MKLGLAGLLLLATLGAAGAPASRLDPAASVAAQEARPRSDDLRDPVRQEIWREFR